VTVLKATTNKTTNPILEGIKLKAYNNILELSATDSELSIVKRIKADISKEGEIVVPGNFFSNYIRRLTTEQIKLVLNDGNLLKISYTDSEGYIQCYSAEEFPVIKKIDDDEFFEITQKDFKTLINKSIFAVAIDDSRPILKGVLLEIGDNTINAVALDGYRMALVKKNIVSSNVKTSIIVPSRSLAEISKLLQESDEQIKIFVKENTIMLNLDNVEIVSRLLEGEFINYRQILPNEYLTECVINKVQFDDTLDRASLLAKFDKNNLVKFEIKENNILITSNSEMGNIRENLPVSLKGNDISIAFNARYLSDILKVSNDEFLTLKMNSPYSPCVIEALDNDEYLFLVLPVRMSN
ncbi:MAG: DNA polymerase III subunit beta, partial [Christensenellales bacterium]